MQTPGRGTLAGAASWQRRLALLEGLLEEEERGALAVGVALQEEEAAARAALQMRMMPPVCPAWRVVRAGPEGSWQRQERAPAGTAMRRPVVAAAAPSVWAQWRACA
jgi:hypothetical protein